MIEHNPIPIHSYKKWNGIVHICVPLNPQFKIGDICKVIHEGSRYPSYDQMAIALSKTYNLNYDNWHRNWHGVSQNIGNENDSVEIIAYAIHCSKVERIVYAVRPDYTHKWIMIGEEGLKIINTKPFFEEMDFLL